MRASSKKRLEVLELRANPPAPESHEWQVAENSEQHPDLYSYKGKLYTDKQLSALLIKHLIIIEKSYGPLDRGDLDDGQE